MKLAEWLAKVAPTRDWSPAEFLAALSSCWTTRPTRVSMTGPGGEKVVADVKSYEPGNTPDDL